MYFVYFWRFGHNFDLQEPGPDEMEIQVPVTKNGPFYINETFDSNEDILDSGGRKNEIVRISNGKISVDMDDGTRLW